MTANTNFVHRLQKLMEATKRKQLKWERSEQSTSCSCEYQGKLLILAKYKDASYEDYFVIDGLDDSTQNQSFRVFNKSIEYATIKAFYNQILKKATTTSIDR